MYWYKTTADGYLIIKEVRFLFWTWHREKVLVKSEGEAKNIVTIFNQKN